MLYVPLKISLVLNIKARYESLKKRRGHKKAIIAIARLLLTAIYHILLNGEVFDYTRLDSTLNRIKKNKNKMPSTDEMISQLTKLGYSITLQNN